MQVISLYDTGGCLIGSRIDFNTQTCYKFAYRTQIVSHSNHLDATFIMRCVKQSMRVKKCVIYQFSRINLNNWLILIRSHACRCVLRMLFSDSWKWPIRWIDQMRSNNVRARSNRIGATKLMLFEHSSPKGGWSYTTCNVHRESKECDWWSEYLCVPKLKVSNVGPFLE